MAGIFKRLFGRKPAEPPKVEPPVRVVSRAVGVATMSKPKPNQFGAQDVMQAAIHASIAEGEFKDRAKTMARIQQARAMLRQATIKADATGKPVEIAIGQRVFIVHGSAR